VVSTADKSIEQFADADAFRAWLTTHHADDAGIRLKIAKKGAPVATVSYADALDVALAFGWIDGQKASFDADYFLQVFTRRRARSIWSRRNVEKVSAMIEAGTMEPSGLAQVDAAKADGRWDRAYEGSPASKEASNQSPEFLKALEKNPAAKEFYATLNAVNRYAIYFRIHNARREDTRSRRIANFVEMLARGETLH
jgi:uncharacterized protein YdeI (YjbR/CyaY-like superfamily)